MKIEISLNVAVVCGKSYAVEFKNGVCAVCVPCMHPLTRVCYPVYMFFDDTYNENLPIGKPIAYEWNENGLRVYLPDSALTRLEKGALSAVSSF